MTESTRSEIREARGVLCDDSREAIRRFCRSFKLMPLRPEFVGSLVAHMHGYSDEGRRVAPSVYLTNHLARATRALSAIEVRLISQDTVDEQGARRLVSHCAPLASDDWAVFCEVSGGGIAYGMFRFNETDRRVKPHVVKRAARCAEGDGLEIASVWESGASKVELKGSRGVQYRLRLNSRSRRSQDETVRRLLASICPGDGNTNVAETFRALRSVVHDVVQQRKGCMIAVVDASWAGGEPCEDAVVLKSPISFPSMLHDVRNGTLEADAVKKSAALVKSMVLSDGIAVFDAAAQFRAYRWFVQLPKQSTQPTGGARERAFGALCALVDDGALLAAFIQSSDGMTRFRRGDGKNQLRTLSSSPGNPSHVASFDRNPGVVPEPLVSQKNM